MDIKVYADAESAAREAARILAAEARECVAARGRVLMAVSGGSAPLPMFRALAGENVPWDKVQLFQVDERIAPAGNPDRNFLHLRECLLDHVPLPPANIHPMPVEDADPAAAAARYEATLKSVAGSPPVLDLVHLGLGPDGHTASLVPGDPALDIADADVALSGPYQGRLRMTLTFPVINRARRILWLVTDGEKAAMLVRVRAGDQSIPGGRVRHDGALIVADRAAAAKLDHERES